MIKLSIRPILCLALATLALLATGCSRSRHEALFEEIEARIAADPEAAHAYVDSLAATPGWRDSVYINYSDFV